MPCGESWQHFRTSAPPEHPQFSSPSGPILRQNPQPALVVVYEGLGVLAVVFLAAELVHQVMVIVKVRRVLAGMGVAGVALTLFGAGDVHVVCGAEVLGLGAGH